MSPPGKAVGGTHTGGIAYVDTLVPAPRLGLSTPHTGRRVGQVLIVSGDVANAIDSVRTVQIWRHLAGKTRLYGTATISGTNSFTWTMRARSPGTLVLFATYKAGGATFKSEPVTVRVRWDAPFSGASRRVSVSGCLAS